MIMIMVPGIMTTTTTTTATVRQAQQQHHHVSPASLLRVFLPGLCLPVASASRLPHLMARSRSTAFHTSPFHAPTGPMELALPADSGLLGTQSCMTIVPPGASHLHHDMTHDTNSTTITSSSASQRRRPTDAMTSWPGVGSEALALWRGGGWWLVPECVVHVCEHLLLQVQTVHEDHVPQLPT